MLSFHRSQVLEFLLGGIQKKDSFLQYNLYSHGNVCWRRYLSRNSVSEERSNRVLYAVHIYLHPISLYQVHQAHLNILPQFDAHLAIFPRICIN